MERIGRSRCLYGEDCLGAWICIGRYPHCPENSDDSSRFAGQPMVSESLIVSVLSESILQYSCHGISIGV